MRHPRRWQRNPFQGERFPSRRLLFFLSSLFLKGPLMASTNLSLFSPQRTRMGVVLGNGQARVTRREIEQVAA